jgi:hypothetical protein
MNSLSQEQLLLPRNQESHPRSASSRRPYVDAYKERGLEVVSVQVEVTGRFSTKGAAAEDLQYRVSVKAKSSKEEVLELMRHTDTVAEVHNTLRRGAAVILRECIVEDCHS